MLVDACQDVFGPKGFDECLGNLGSDSLGSFAAELSDNLPEAVDLQRGDARGVRFADGSGEPLFEQGDESVAIGEAGADIGLQEPSLRLQRFDV